LIRVFPALLLLLAVPCIAKAQSVGQLGQRTKWHDHACIDATEICLVGDFNGDGRDELAVIPKTGGLAGKLFLAISDGTRFISPNAETRSGMSTSANYRVGDVDGDLFDDAATRTGCARILGRRPLRIPFVGTYRVSLIPMATHDR
jgi:hypothetical protein